MNGKNTSQFELLWDAVAGFSCLELLGRGAHFALALFYRGVRSRVRADQVCAGGVQQPRALVGKRSYALSPRVAFPDTQ
jgi:hypothetical protein